MRNTAISWKRNQHFHVNNYSGSEEIQYSYKSIDRYIHEKNAYRLTNMINIKWIRRFKFVRLPTKFLCIYTFVKRGPGNIENLQETSQIFPNTSEK